MLNRDFIVKALLDSGRFIRDADGQLLAAIDGIEIEVGKRGRSPKDIELRVRFVSQGQTVSSLPDKPMRVGDHLSIDFDGKEACIPISFEVSKP